MCAPHRVFSLLFLFHSGLQLCSSRASGLLTFHLIISLTGPEAYLATSSFTTREPSCCCSSSKEDGKLFFFLLLWVCWQQSVPLCHCEAIGTRLLNKVTLLSIPGFIVLVVESQLKKPRKDEVGELTHKVPKCIFVL